MFQYMKLSTRLYTGFGIFIFFVAIVCIFAIFQIQTLIKLTNTLNYYPSITHVAVRKINLNIMHMRTKIEKLAYFYDRTKLNKVRKSLASYEIDVKRNINTIEKHFFGSKQNIDRVRKLFQDWKPIINEIIALYRKNSEKVAHDKVFKGENAIHIAKLEKALAVLTEFADISTELNLSQANSQTKNILWLAVFIVIGLFSGVWIMFLIYRKVAADVNLSFDIADAMVKGDLQGKLQCDPDTNSGRLLDILDKARDEFNDRTQTVAEIEEQVANLKEVKQEIEENKHLVELREKKEDIQRQIALDTLRASKSLDTIFTGFFLEENAIETDSKGYSTTGEIPTSGLPEGKHAKDFFGHLQDGNW
ncbi:MAG: MCP four helix bundle domain-containing protein [Candidatus Marithrix sp.]|nr:MCP four helix bundle domain-containing protein [Candidatus Marithrix sp.]